MEDVQKVVVLGSGHRSQVWLVKRNSQMYALKEVPKDGLSQIEVQHLFNEKSAFQSLSHSGLIQAPVISHDAKNLYFLMNLASGAPLSHIAGRNQRFAEDQVKAVCVQLADILVYLRSQGWIYRDLKLSNVFWDQDGKVTLVDLGFCKKIQGERTYTVCGTRHMMSPEIFRHLVEGGEAGGYGYECDYWALGILAYELLKGRPPFGLNDGDIYEKILKGNVDYTGLSESAISFISALLVSDPSLRLGHREANELLGHPWLQTALLPVLPDAVQSTAMQDWCEFLQDEDSPSAEAQEAFAEF